MASAHRPNPRGLLPEELDQVFEDPPCSERTTRLPLQIYRSLFRDRVASLDEAQCMGRHKKQLCRERLNDDQLELVSKHAAGDRSIRHVFRLHDELLVESVLLWHHGQWTVCVSSQAGCALGCRFCATGLLGLSRNLESWEIVDQIIQVGREAGVRVGDVVFMGMGEPLMNTTAVYHAARVMTEAQGLQISRRRITVSTAGVVPEIHRFIEEQQPWRLVFSLGAAVPEKRARLMPIQERYGFDSFLDAIRSYERHRGGKHVTLEYVAIKNLTMGDDDIDAIREHLRGFRFLLNVIPYNDVGAGFESPTMSEVRHWTAKLRPLNIPVKIRYSGGQAESAGCGQLGRALMSAGDLAPRRS